MKIALVDLCKNEDFAKSSSYLNALEFLKEEGITFLDFATGTDSLTEKTHMFNLALESDADLIWVIRGGTTCIQTLRGIDWEKVSSSKKSFYGLSDFTHFSTLAVPRGATCYYGQGLAYISRFFPTTSDREFIVNLLREGEPTCEMAIPLTNSGKSINPKDIKIIGGFLPAFNLLQGMYQIDLSERFVFLEYHSDLLGETLIDLGYLLNQFIYLSESNKPKGVILGHIELKDSDGSLFKTDVINEYCAGIFSNKELPVYFIDHFANTITFR